MNEMKDSFRMNQFSDSTMQQQIALIERENEELKKILSQNGLECDKILSNNS